MYGCMDVWMYRCIDVWMYGCMDVWMYGFMEIRYKMILHLQKLRAEVKSPQNCHGLPLLRLVLEHQSSQLHMWMAKRLQLFLSLNQSINLLTACLNLIKFYNTVRYLHTFYLFVGEFNMLLSDFLLVKIQILIFMRYEIQVLYPKFKFIPLVH